MDSKLIFIKGSKLLPKVAWKPTSDFGWLYCGRSEDLKLTFLNQTISTHFLTDMVYIVTDRHTSELVSKSDIVSLITNNIDRIDFAFWDQNFVRVIEFSKVGVFRVGEVMSEAPQFF